MSSFLGFLETIILVPLYYVVSAVLLAWHWVFDHIPGMSDGWTWVLSIIGLTFTIRAALIPLFVKQIKSSRNMQLLQPKIRELQKKYGHDRERMAQEQMKLWKETGTNPFASCLPILLQMPIFFALFRVLNLASRENWVAAGLLTESHVESIRGASIFGADIAATFLNGEGYEIRILAMILVIMMCATTFLTQRQLMTQNMPPEALSGPYAQQQKILLYILPFAFAFGGFFFPIGVIVYWTTSNLWTMGQQFYVIRRNPAPGTPAFKAKQSRDRAAGKLEDEDPSDAGTTIEAPKPRQQPKKQARSQRKKGQGGPKKKGKK